MKKTRYILFISLLGIVLACQKDKERDPETPKDYEFGVTLRNQDYTESIVLSDVGFSGLSSVENLPAWIEDVTVACEAQQAAPVAQIKVKGDRDLEDSRTATVLLKLTNGSTVKLQLIQWPLLTDGDNAVYKSQNVAFEQDWASAKTIKLVVANTATNGQTSIVTQEVSLPWAIENNPVSWLPRANGGDTREVVKMLNNKQDWSLVFNLTGVQSQPNRNYFGLYNRYLGILRIFYYFTEELVPGNTTNDHLWRFAVSEDLAEHVATQFALPVNEDATINFKTAASQPAYISPTTDDYNPFSQEKQAVLKVGWWAFDVNMAAYRRHNLFAESSANSTVDISLFTTSKSQIFLNSVIEGNLNGKLDGSVQLKQLAPKSMATWGKVLVPIVNTAGNMVMNTAFVKEVIGHSAAAGANDVNVVPDQVPPAELGPALRIGPVASMVVCLVVGSVISLAGKYLGWAAEQEPNVGDLGRMSLDASYDLNAVMTTAGTIDSPTTNIVPAVSMTKAYFNEFNPDGSRTCMGEGIWNLNNHPVVYIVKDAFWYENHFTAFGERKEYPLGSSTSYAADVYSYDLGATKGSHPGLRLITFMDPTSVKGITFNSDLYDDAFTDVNVYLSYGVYPGATPGYTDTFRRNAHMDFPHTWRLTAATQTKADKQPQKDTLFHSTTLKMVKKPHTDILFSTVDVSDDYREIAGYRLSAQALRTEDPGLERRYYGASSYYANPYASPFELDNVQFVYDPQIYVPFDDRAHRLYDPQVPDLVVSAAIVAIGKDKKDEKNYSLTSTLRFLPKIELISYKDLPAVYQKILQQKNEMKGADGCESTVWKDMNAQIQHIEDIKNAFGN